MKVNIQKRIFKGVTLSLVLCAVILGILSPVALAATSTMFMCEVTGNVNVRELPDADSDIVTTYQAGTTFMGDPENWVAYEDGYYWYWCPDGYVAQTGRLRFYEVTQDYDNICAYDPYGSQRWEHECSGNDNPDWGYNISVDEGGYLVSCDCGWSEYFYVSYVISDDGDYGNQYTELVFVGLDTDNDEIVDLRPGEKKFLPNRANSELRKYQILEFLDDPDKLPPVINLQFRDGDNKVIAMYTFPWSVEVHVEPYGVVMVGNDGIKKIHYVDYDFMLHDETLDLYLADTPRVYDVFTEYGDKVIIGEGHGDEWCFVFILAPVGEGPWSGFEYIINVIRNAFSGVGGLFSDFGNLGSVFSDEDSPLYNLLHNGFSEGVQEVFTVVRTFFSCIPTPIMNVIGTVFILVCLLGVFKLFHG